METIKQAKELLRYLRSKDVPTWLHGAPGIGKSAVVKQLTDELKIGFIDIRLGTRLPEDLNGIPAPDLQNKVAVWLKANFWPNEKRDGKVGIILFDELSDASRALQSCAYQLILDRKLNEFELPPGWWPCAAGNRREDRAAAQSISTALANRFAHIHVSPDKAAWKEWANKNGINPLVVAFIDFRPQYLHCMDATVDEEANNTAGKSTSEKRHSRVSHTQELSFPTPRSWEQVSKIIDAPERLRPKLVRALVGEGVAGEMEAFLKAVDLPDFDQILANPKKTFIPDNPSSKYALSCMLARRIDRQNFAKVYEYISRDAFGREFEIVTIIDATKRDMTLCDAPPFTKFAERNQDIAM